jgi:hypothetical protein
MTDWDKLMVNEFANIVVVEHFCALIIPKWAHVMKRVKCNAAPHERGGGQKLPAETRSVSRGELSHFPREGIRLPSRNSSRCWSGSGLETA